MFFSKCSLLTRYVSIRNLIIYYAGLFSTGKCFILARKLSTITQLKPHLNIKGL